MLMLTFVLWLTQASPLSPQPAIEYRWIRGLDIVATLPETPAGPPVNILGFDRDTGTFSLLYQIRACYTRWVYAPPFRGEGGVTHLMPLSPTTVAVYFESGRLDLMQIPTDLTCTGVAVPIMR